MASQASCSGTQNIFKTGANKWKFVKTFESLKEAQKSIGDDWKKRYSNTSTIGELRLTTSVYCFHHEKTCKAKIQLVYPEVNGSASYFELEVMDHGDLPQKLKSGLSYSQKEVVRHVVEQGRRRPNGILRTIDTLKLCDVPVKKKLCQFIKTVRKKVNSSMMYLSDLTDWCTTQVIIPEDDDKPYVAAFNADVIEDENKCVFHVGITTNRLLRLLKLSDVIHIDATYKVSYEGYPCIVAGITDMGCHFHPVILCLSTGEAGSDYEIAFNALKMGILNLDNYVYAPKVLVADAAKAITIGFEAAFGSIDYKRVVCWAHVATAIKSRLDKIAKVEVAIELKQDINILQICPTTEIFSLAVRLFKNKWKVVPEAKDFLSYFVNQWIDQNCGWFEGFSLLLPSTNNAQEAFHRVVKLEETDRERKPIAMFLPTLLAMANKYSCERCPGYVNEVHFVRWGFQPYELAVQKKAYQWLKMPPAIVNHSLEDNIEVLYVQPSTRGIINKSIVNQMQRRYKNFSNFEKLYFAAYVVTLHHSEWKKSTCSCPSFLKRYVCKHIFGPAVKRKLTEFLPAAIVEPINIQRIKKGRPTKASRQPLSRQ